MVRRDELVEVVADPLCELVEVGTVDAGEKDEAGHGVGILTPF